MAGHADFRALVVTGAVERPESRQQADDGCDARANVQSDFTAMQLALLAQVGLITFSAPMLAGNFGAATLSEFTLHHFWQALTSPTVEVRWQSETPDEGEWQGTLWGGNLAMICSLVGTPWMPQLENGILLITELM